MTHDLDGAILSAASNNWRKVAFVLTKTLHGLEDVGVTVDVNDLAERLKTLVVSERLESQGNLDRWRYSEVRLPQSD